MAQHKPLNPYIAGSALDGPQGFFGREDILRLVESELRTPHQNAVVLFGQRRIGKTSVLLQLRRRLAESNFVPVYLDLMDRARRPLGAVLAELAAETALELGLEPPAASRFDDEGRYFRREFLPAAYAALGEGETTRRLVFLLDEFDVLDLAAAEGLPDIAAARAFFPFIRELMAQEKRLGFVIVVGRKTEELSTDFRAAFRAARYRRVSVLDEADARALIRQTEKQGTLRYTAPAVDRILALTAGHPYFTQLTCFVLFERAWARCDAPDECLAPEVTQADVEAAVPQVLEAGNNAFEWVWDGLPPAERIIFAAIAEGTEEGRVLDEDQIVGILQEHGIRILIGELKLAPRTLVEWEMLRRVDGGYRFFIELMRRWVEKHKPLARVRDELDRVDPIADQFYRLGRTFYYQRNPEAAIEQLRRAVATNPNHLQARLLLGRCLREQGDLAAAIQELEWAYEYDAPASRYELAYALLRQAEALEKAGREEEALAVYERVLVVSPRERLARERRAALYEKRGDAALEAGDYAAALAAYEQAGAREKMRKAAARQRQMERKPRGASTYNIAAIRELLLEAFTPEELRRLCYDQPIFRPIVNKFAPKHGLSEMVDVVITYCDTHVLFSELLPTIEQRNPRKYKQFNGRLVINQEPDIAEQPHDFAEVRDLPFSLHTAAPGTSSETSLDLNPFVYPSPVPPYRLVGRKGEIRRLIGRVTTGQNTMIVGGPKIGKSSLLKYLASCKNCRDLLAKGATKVFPIFLSSSMLSPQALPMSFWRPVMLGIQEYSSDDELGKIASQIISHGELDGSNMQRIIEKISQRNWRLILFVDDLDKLLDYETINTGFFGALGALAPHYDSLAVVAASRLSLEEMNRRSMELRPYGAPFFSGFAELLLQPFDDSGVKDLLRYALKDTSVNFDEKDRAFLHAMAGHHPFFLQVAASTLFDVKKESGRYQVAFRAFHDVMRPHFEEMLWYLDDQQKLIVVILCLAELQGRLDNQMFDVGDLGPLERYGNKLEDLVELGFVELWTANAKQINWKNWVLWYGDRWRVTSRCLVWWASEQMLLRRKRDWLSWLYARKKRDTSISEAEINTLQAWMDKFPRNMIKDANKVTHLLLKELLYVV